MSLKGDPQGTDLDQQSSANLIAFVSRENQDSISIFEANLVQYVTKLLERHTDLDTLPIAFISVLGSEEANHRKLLTDWLIHYFTKEVDRLDKNERYDYVEGSINLRYLGPSNHTSSHDGALFVWPTPFLLKEIKGTEDRTGRQKMLLFILSATTNQSTELMDRFCACVSSNILIFSESDKNRTAKFIRDANQRNSQSECSFGVDSCIHILHPRDPSVTIKDSWKQFVTDMENITLQTAMYNGQCLTLTNVICYLKDMQKMVKETARSNSGNGNKGSTQAVQDNEVPASGNNSIEMEPRPAEGTIEGNRSEQEVRESISEQVESIIALMNVGDSDKDRARCHALRQTFNANLGNMFDNYVCFDGDRDVRQMNKFFESAYKKAKSMLLEIKPGTKESSLTMLDETTRQIFELYKAQNSKIIESEKDNIRNVTQGVERDYKIKLDECIVHANSVHSRGDLESIHQRMKKQCIAIVARAMNYSGKLNNIVNAETKNMVESLNHYFETDMANINFHCTPKATTQASYDNEIIQNPVQAYCKDMQSIISSGIASDLLKWKRSHDSITKKVTDGLGMQEREQLSLVLDSHWMNMVEAKVEELGFGLDQQFPKNYMGIYLNQDWLKFTFGSDQHPDKQVHSYECPALVAYWRGPPSRFSWGHGVSKNACEVRPTSSGHLFDFIFHKADEDMVARLMLTNFIRKIKAKGETLTKQGIEKLVMAIPSWFAFADKYFLRECSKEVGFWEVVMLTESSLAVYERFSLLLFQKQSIKDALILVVIPRPHFIRFEIFGCKLLDAKISGVELLAISSETCPLSDQSHNADGLLPPQFLVAYQRTLSQLTEVRRKNVRYFVVSPDIAEWTGSFDTFFQEKQMLKIDHFRTLAYNALTKLLTGTNILHEFLQVFAHTPPDGETFKKPSSTESDSSKYLVKRKEDLLDKCKRMETQIGDSSVEIGKLRVIIILEAIRVGRMAAEENMLEGPEAQEIFDLFELHNFK